MPRRKTKEEFINEAIEKHGDKYIYDKVKYINSSINVIITCRIHGDFPQNPNSHLRGHGCKECNIIRVADKTRKTIEQFIKDAIEIHGYKYIYDKVEYINSKTEVIITCRIHGDFPQRPNSHLNGNGCSKCSGHYQCKTSEWIIKAIEKHGDKYIYDNVEYINSKMEVIITCIIHGDFEQQPNAHLQGQGCRKCAGNNYLKTTEEFIEDAIKIHGDKYNYDKVEYIGNKKEVIITCKIHDICFKQTPNNHLREVEGCSKCSPSGYSLAQIIWLEYMMIKDNTYIYHAENEGEYKIKVNGKDTKVDGYSQELNKVYEYHGDYYHGNPKKFDREKIFHNNITFGELYDKTMKRTKDIRALGYEVVEMWESDFDIIKCKIYIQYEKLRKELIEQ